MVENMVARIAFIFRQREDKRVGRCVPQAIVYFNMILTVVAAALMIVALKLSHAGEKMSEHLENPWKTLGAYLSLMPLQHFGLTAVPYFLAGRIIILNLFVFSLIIYQFYSASLVSNLLIQPKSDIKTVSDILQSNMKVGCEDILYNKDYFIYTTDKSHKQMYKKLMRAPNNSFLDPGEGIRLVDKGGYAFHVELVTGYPIIQKTFSNKHICELNQVPFVHRLAEHGILHREILFWHPKKPECNQAEKMFNVIGFDYFCPALSVLGCGMLFSLVIFIGEMYVRYQDRIFWWRQKEKNCIRPFVN
nr:unnamed protein product [Callosobruchus chinensis]